MRTAKRDANRARELVLATLERHNGPISPKSLFNSMERHDEQLAKQYTMRTFRDVLYDMRDRGELVAQGEGQETRYALPEQPPAPREPDPPTLDELQREILAVVAQRGPISAKSLYTQLAPETTKALTFRTVRYKLYNMKAAGDLVDVGTYKNDARYDLPEKVNARAREVVNQRDQQRERKIEQTAQITRAELEQMRVRLKMYRKYLPDGWHCLALQLDEQQLAELQRIDQIRRDRLKELAAAADQLRVEARDQPVEFVTVEQQQQLAAPADEPQREQQPSVAVEFSELSQYVAQQAALTVERALGSYARGQELLLAAERDKNAALRAQIVEHRETIVEREQTICELQAQNNELQLKVDAQPVLEVEIGKLHQQIAQLKADVETALATAQENEIDASKYRAMMAAINKAA